MTGRNDDSLVHLLAIRLVYDLALWQQFGHNAKVFAEWQEQLAHVEKDDGRMSPSLLARYVAQLAVECHYQSELMAQLRNHPPTSIAPEPRALQAIFCIDVRSEVFRRALEAQSGQIEIIGFAGFSAWPSNI